ncbi:MAG: BrnA antitoxin family protein [Treponema sp.]|nr:BrnA antitoxin family protein [Treponema sp.]
MAIVSFTKEELRNKPSRSNWALVEKLIAEGTEVYDEDNPTWTEEEIAKALCERAARLGRPKLPDGKKKQGTYIRFAPQVLAHLRTSGKNWQSRVSNKIEELIAKGEL